MKRLWILLGKLFFLSMAVNAAVELFSRKSLSGLGGYFRQPAGISVKRTSDTDSLSSCVFYKKKNLLHCAGGSGGTGHGDC